MPACFFPRSRFGLVLKSLLTTIDFANGPDLGWFL